MTTEAINHWHTCVVDNDYEISDEYPYSIRRIGSDKVIGESDDGHGYVKCKLNSITFRKHVIVATQFIPNPDNLPCIDHINRDKSDYHVSNLRWCTYRENNMNKSSNNGVELEYFDELPDDAFEVREYGNHRFNDLFYSEDNDEFYFWNGVQYRKLTIVYNRGSATVKAWTTANKRVDIYYSKFKKIYNLVQ